ncbi:MAG TPA: SMP-30/gluconolactonase/LRE family protein [Trichococcus flocculiformis]|nr:SMP-30/gluconolactonase/LRE family protein [Trichococcus flocculiformis]
MEKKSEKDKVRKPELVFYAGSTLLEGPHWDAQNNLIYCVSIEDNMIYAIDPETGEVGTYLTEGPVGCAVLDQKGMILEAEKSGIFRIDPRTKEKQLVAKALDDERMRYNDGKLDPKGRLLVGTMGYDETYEGESALYAIEKDGTVRTVLDGLTLANGMGWSPDGKTLYFIDTPTKKVGSYAYDPETGEAIFEKYVIEITDDSNPDGMCVDMEGMIWVAQYGGEKVCRWDPESGVKLEEIRMPVKNVTSCCLGGENLEYLYITTAKDGETQEALAGGLFRVKLS